MGVPRTGHCAVGISGGRVLIVGGRDGEQTLRTTEVYGPEDRFVAGAPLKQARAGHSCTPLDDGRVLLAGGWTEEGLQTTLALMIRRRTRSAG